MTSVLGQLNLKPQCGICVSPLQHWEQLNRHGTHACDVCTCMFKSHPQRAHPTNVPIIFSLVTEILSLIIFIFSIGRNQKLFLQASLVFTTLISCCFALLISLPSFFDPLSLLLVDIKKHPLWRSKVTQKYCQMQNVSVHYIHIKHLPITEAFFQLIHSIYFNISM